MSKKIIRKKKTSPNYARGFKNDNGSRKKTVLMILIPCVAFAVVIIAVAAATGAFSNRLVADVVVGSESGSEAVSETGSETVPETVLSTSTTDEIKDGDTVNIDYVGYVDGVAFEGGDTQGAGTDLTIGSGTYIDDFEQQLIGHKVGDEVEVNVTFPDDYGSEELQGADATFEVVINGIYK